MEEILKRWPEEAPEETPDIFWYATSLLQFVTEVFCLLFPGQRKALGAAYRLWLGDVKASGGFFSPAKGGLSGAQEVRLVRYYLLEPTAKIAEFLRRLREDTVLDIDNSGQGGG